jgi:anti-sigma factor ChrR (cupin superfamily)
VVVRWRWSGGGVEVSRVRCGQSRRAWVNMKQRRKAVHLRRPRTGPGDGEGELE